jgi:hypothetical protein
MDEGKWKAEEAEKDRKWLYNPSKISDEKYHLGDLGADGRL